MHDEGILLQSARICSDSGYFVNFDVPLRGRSWPDLTRDQFMLGTQSAKDDQHVLACTAARLKFCYG
jgi:hypothetical protein